MEPISAWLGWQQPAIKSNNTYGIITASSFSENCEPYKAVDGVTDNISMGWATDNSNEGWWKWELPIELKFKRIVFVNRNSAENDPDILSQQCQFYIGNKETKMGSQFSVSKSREYVTVDCEDLTSNILYFYKFGGKYSGIGELIIEASEYKTVGQKIDMSLVTKAYTQNQSLIQIYSDGKLIWEDLSLNPYRSFVQPAFIDNFTYGSLNSSSAGSYAYKALDQIDDFTSSTNSFITTASTPQWFLWTFPHAIIIKKIVFKNNYSESGERTKTFQIFADENKTIPITPEITAINENGGVSEVDVDAVETSQIYCYLKDSYGSNGIAGIGELKIEGYKRLDAGSILDPIVWGKYFLTVNENNEVVNSETLEPEGFVSTNNAMEESILYKLFEETSNEIAWTSSEVSSWVDQEVPANVPWVQPMLTSNTSYGTITAGGIHSNEDYAPYRISDGSDISWSSGTSDITKCWIAWEFPETLTLNSVKIYTSAVGNVFKLYSDLAMQQELSPEITAIAGSGSIYDDNVAEYTFDSPVSVNCIVIKTITKQTTYVSIGEVVIDAEVAGIDLMQPPYILMELPQNIIANGITLVNGNSAIKSFEWQGSTDGQVYTSLGTIQTPEFSWVSNSECNISLPFSDLTYTHYKFIVRELANNANVVSVKKLLPNLMKKI